MIKAKSVIMSDSNGLEMLGAFRFYLATSVILAHLLNSFFHDSGRNVVAGFFVVSGYLVTLICNGAYRKNPLKYLGNRFLRIFPTYWTCLVLIVISGLVFPEVVQFGGLGIYIPNSTTSWINQFTIIPVLLDGGGIFAFFHGIFNSLPLPMRTISQAWSLQAELIFYVLIGLITARSYRVTSYMTLVTCIVGFFTLIRLLDYEFYWSFCGNSFMFYLGSFAYFKNQRSKLNAIKWQFGFTISFIGMFILPAFVSEHQAPENLIILNSFIYLSAIGVFLFLLALPRISIKSALLIDCSRALGRLSYPMFLIHMGVAIPVVNLTGEMSFSCFIVTYVITIIISSLVIYYVEGPVELYRSKIRDDMAPSTS